MSKHIKHNFCFKQTKIIFLSCVQFLCLCAFEPADIVFKNINLIPEPFEKNDRYPHLPQNYTNAKSEKINKEIKVPSIQADKTAASVVNVNKILNNTIITSREDIINAFIPTAEGIGNMFHVNDILPSNKQNKSSGIDLSPSFLEKETSKLPILNDLPGMSYIYNKKTPIVKNIKDIQVPGLDAVLPTNVGQPLTPKDYDINQHLNFFSDFITPDKVLNSNFFDVLP